MNKRLFNDIKTGINQMIAHQQGKIKLPTEVVLAIKPPKQYTAKDVKRIRANNFFSQFTFAKILNVSQQTICAWESGLRKPSGPVLRMLEAIDKGLYVPTDKLKN